MIAVSIIMKWNLGTEEMSREVEKNATIRAPSADAHVSSRARTPIPQGLT
jgi:hypothetical protein